MSAVSRSKDSVALVEKEEIESRTGLRQDADASSYRECLFVFVVGGGQMSM